MADLGIYKGSKAKKTTLIFGDCPAYLLRMREIGKLRDLCIYYFSVCAMRAYYYRVSELLLQYNNCYNVVQQKRISLLGFEPAWIGW